VLLGHECVGWNEGVLFGHDGVLLAGNDRGGSAYAGRGKPRPYEESGVISSVGQDAGRTVNRGCYK